MAEENQSQAKFWKRTFWIVVFLAALLIFGQVMQWHTETAWKSKLEISGLQAEGNVITGTVTNIADKPLYNVQINMEYETPGGDDRHGPVRFQSKINKGGDEISVGIPRYIDLDSEEKATFRFTSDKSFKVYGIEYVKFEKN